VALQAAAEGQRLSHFFVCILRPDRKRGRVQRLAATWLGSFCVMAAFREPETQRQHQLVLILLMSNVKVYL
jgi:hypothetical protein